MALNSGDLPKLATQSNKLFIFILWLYRRLVVHVTMAIE